MRDHAYGPVLILAPIGRDAALAAGVLAAEGLLSKIFPDLGALTEAVGADTGAVILAEEGLRSPHRDQFLALLRAQPTWSDLPVLLLTSATPTRDAIRLAPDILLTLLERPLRSATLVSTIQAALRARIRQWQARDLLLQRDEALESLSLSEERLRFATLAGGIGTWEYRPATDELIWDDQCRAHFGQRPETPASFETFRAGLHPDDLEEVDAAIATAISPEGSGKYNIEYRTVGLHDGIVRWIAAAGRVIRDPDNDILRFMGTTIDITSRKLADTALREAKAQADAANAAKDRFLATLSHELRTPLTPILMCLSFRATQDDLPPDLQDDLAMIRRNVELEARLIDDMLDLTRVAHGKMELRLEMVDCHEIIEATRNICEASTAARSQIEIVIEPLATNVRLSADRARLQQIIWNLVQNAVKFSADGQNVTIRTTNPTPGRLAIDVIDHGRGIEPDRLAKLFDAFEQGDRSITTQYGGLGLGLAIAKALVDLHGGTISAASKGPGHGSTFTIEMNTLSEATVERKETACAVTETGRALRILVVEDHPSTLRILQRLIARAGHDVATADCVAAGLHELAGPPFDLLITDLGLPDGSGFDLLAAIDQSRTASIAFSGFGMMDDVERCREAGFTRHVTKPIDWDHLTAIISEVAGKFKEG